MNGRVILPITPRILEETLSTSFGSDACFDLISTALLSSTVWMALSPLALIVSPDSAGHQIQHPLLWSSHSPTRSTMPSATPRAHATSTLPLRYLMFVFNCLFFILVPLELTLSDSTASSSRAKNWCVRPTKLVQMLCPIKSFGSL